jgi:amino-acid N-acetyltransferase
MRIMPLGADELPEVAALLGANGLPTDDLSPGIALFGVRDGHGLEGVVGIERHGEVGLLRSLAVRHDRRQSGLGSALVLEAERLAGANGIRALYLLTTTAEAFFARRGYVPAPRVRAPAAIQHSSEFTSLCPDTAAFMGKTLPAEMGVSGS